VLTILDKIIVAKSSLPYNNRMSHLNNNHPKKIFLLMTVLAGIFLLYPFTDFQSFLSQGDHGRDLYAFEQTLHGAKVYRDYWWVYGPLMPIYYSFFDRFLGTTIHSILIGEMILHLFSGILIYLTLGMFFSVGAAFASAVWFWTFNADFFFTYNHAGGITMLTLTTYSLFLYLKIPKIRYLILGLISIVLLSLIKLNFGVSALVAFTISVTLIDFLNKTPFSPQKRYFYFLCCLVPFLILLICAMAVQGLSTYEIRQCLPYLKGDQPYEASVWNSARSLLGFTFNNMKATWPNLIFAFIFIVSIWETFYLTIRNKDGKTLKNQRIVIIAVLLLFLLANLHEFLMSGVFYRSYWMKPFQVMTIFAFIAIATEPLKRVIRTFLYAVILFIAFLHFQSQMHLLGQLKIPHQYLSHPKAKIFVGNSLPWIDTVNRTTEYLSTHLRTDETFFALPYDCLYYYLTGKTSPTRQLIFFEHIKIPAEQEKKVIQELKDKRVDFVLLSSRFASDEHGLGILGKTYCPILGKYLGENFRVVATFGDWSNPPGWAWNHGTKILKRTNTATNDAQAAHPDH